MSTGSAPAFRTLPAGARAFIGVVGLGAAGAVTLTPALAAHADADLTLLAVTLFACAAANLFEVFAPGHFSLQPNLVPFVWGAAILPAEAIPLLALASFLPGWMARRSPWFMSAFNVANYVLAGAALHVVAGAAGAFEPGRANALTALALLAGAGAMVFVNHALIGAVAGLAARRPWWPVLVDAVRLRGTAGGRLIDLALATTGACLAALWAEAPGYAPLAAGPILLMGLAVWVPMLRHESRVDAKTGLFNARHLLQLLDDHVDAARRRGAPFALVMVDLDHMRAINNRFGHLEGDRLIRGVADVLGRERGVDAVAARFGGEEFCMLLPGISPERAREVAESVRREVREVRVGDGTAPSVSIGVALFPEHGRTGEELLQAADVALYDAKLGGRDRVRVALPPGARAMLDLNADSRPVRVPVERAEEWEASPADETLRQAASALDAPREAEPPPPDAPSRRWLWPYALVLCAAAVAVGFVSPLGPVVERPGALLMLVGMVLVLDLVRLDLFERVRISPASMPVLALAAMFGPLGPIAAEVAILLLRAARRSAAIRFTFDFGALSLAGAAAAGVFSLGPDGGPWVLAFGILAGLTYYVVNTPLLAVVIGLSRGTSPLANWREQMAWLLPHFAAYGLLAATFMLAEGQLGVAVGLIYTVPVGILWVAERQYVERSRASVTALRTKASDLENANERLRGLLSDNEQLLHRIHHSYLSTITSLARTIEARDPYTGGHTERVGELTRRIAAEMGFKEEDLRAVEVGAVMHDIGKIGIPDRILLKEGPLTPEERAVMERHPEISSYILGDLEMPPLVKQMARSHHERFDGGGYPDGLVGEEIPLAARILTVADTLDAITSNRPYRPARSIAAGLAIIDECSGTQFCPRVVAALHAVLDRDADLRDEQASAAGSATRAA